MSPTNSAEPTALRPRDSIVYHIESIEPDQKRSSQFLANTDIGVLGAHLLKPGEVLDLQHDHLDAFLFVKSGRARFSAGEETREVLQGDGVHIPIGCRYRFEALEATDDSVFQLVQFVSSNTPLPSRISTVKKNLGLTS